MPPPPFLIQTHYFIDAKANFIVHITLDTVKLVRKVAANDVVDEFDRDLVLDTIVQVFECMSLVADLIYPLSGCFVSYLMCSCGSRYPEGHVGHDECPVIFAELERDCETSHAVFRNREWQIT